MKTTAAATMIAVTIMLAAPVQAQVRDETILTYQVLTEEWDGIIGGVLDLSDEEAAAFWPLYREYRAARGALVNERMELIRRFLAGYESMDAAEARALLDASFDIDGKVLSLKREYADRFDDVLPATKVVRLFQSENKLENMMMAEVIKDVPLAR